MRDHYFWSLSGFRKFKLQPMQRNMKNELGDWKALEPLALTSVKPNKQISVQVGRGELPSLPFKASVLCLFYFSRSEAVALTLLTAPLQSLRGLIESELRGHSHGAWPLLALGSSRASSPSPWGQPVAWGRKSSQILHHQGNESWKNNNGN